MQTLEPGVALPQPAQKTNTLASSFAQPRLRPPVLRVFVSVALAGVALRLLVSCLGHNFDLDSWNIAANLMSAGKSVYASTSRYNYAPAGLVLIALAKWLALVLGSPSVQTFHFLFALFLSVADVIIGLFLLRRAGLSAACFYLLNPVSILITGFHSQIDNLALAAGFASWLLLDKDKPARDYASAVLLGLSLAIKHILVFFPLWLLLAGHKRSLRTRVLYATIAYSIPIVMLAGYALIHPGSLPGIQANVINYRGWGFYGTGILPMMGLAIQTTFRGATLPPFASPTLFFAMGMLLVGSLVVWKRPGASFYVYLVALTLFTPTITDQYLIIPLIACSMICTEWPAWLYTAVCTAFLVLISPYNVGSRWPISLVQHYPDLHALVRCLCQVPLLLVLLLLSGAVRRPGKTGNPSLEARPLGPSGSPHNQEATSTDHVAGLSLKVDKVKITWER